MNQSLNVLHIAINKPVRHCFDYLAPISVDPLTLKPGMRVQVPFGKKQLIGILLACNQKSCLPYDKLKHATAVLDDEPILPTRLFTFLTWSAQYYHHPIGEALSNALPQTLRKVRIRSSKKLTTPGKIQQKSGAPVESPLELNKAQQQAVEQITTHVGFRTYLLMGVTGSGKTEVYLQAIHHYLLQGKQALVLVPEIGLTPQNIARFAQRFDVPIAAFHSGLTETERHHAWLQAKNGLVRIIIGTRSAIFTPLCQPGILILDEEHDASFKQQHGFRYSARDLAILRGQMEDIPVLLGSATPSLETLYNVQMKRFHRLDLPERAGKAVPASFQLVDLRRHPTDQGLSQPLLAAINKHLTAGNQVLLFLNRRGYAPVLLCRHCLWVAQCQRCDARLTLHQNPNRLICHHCTTLYPLPSDCEQCGQAEWVNIGCGTERLEQALQQHFPTIPVLRIDKDTMSHREAMVHVLEHIHHGHPQILLGTQMLAKGHHFPNVTLVGIIEMDSGLFTTDFRGLERMGQLILQVAGRAGRADKPGQVYLQTHYPEHPLLQSLLQKGYSAFAEQLLLERHQAAWPPFTYLALVRAEATNAKAPITFLQEVTTLASRLNPNSLGCLMGPVPALMARKAGSFRAVLLFRSPNRQLLQKWLTILLPQVMALKSKSRIRWSVDIDPLDIF